MLPARDPRAELSWLLALDPGGAMTGFDASGWPASTWLLHAMYEDPAGPVDLTHDDALQAGVRAGTVPPEMIGGIDLNDVGVDTGVPLGYVARPAGHYRRLLWSERARRGDYPLAVNPTVPPCFRWFPDNSWPLNVSPPPEGSLDEATLTALLDTLADASPDGIETTCFAFYGNVFAPLEDRASVLTGPLSAIPALTREQETSPSNIWPADRSWLVWTDWDLMGTKVHGPRSLVDALHRHAELETTAWPL